MPGKIVAFHEATYAGCPCETSSVLCPAMLVVETVWRRLTAYFPLMSISYEDTEEKNKDGFTNVSACRIQLVQSCIKKWHRPIKNICSTTNSSVRVFQMVFGRQCRCKESRPGCEVGTFSIRLMCFFISGCDGAKFSSVELISSSNTEHQIIQRSFILHLRSFQIVSTD